MKRTRVEIGRLIVHGLGLSPVAGADLGRRVQANLEQLLLRQGIPTESRRADVVRVRDSASPAGGVSTGDRARVIANAVYRSLQRKG